MELKQAPTDEECRRLIQLAIEEDVGAGDCTSKAVVPADSYGRANIIAREELVFCGAFLVPFVLREVHTELELWSAQPEGQWYSAGDSLLELAGPVHALLTAERVLLNFCQRLSGISTKTRLAVERIAETDTVLRDTRKTAPGWRRLEKYAVFIGGGENHRAGLFDAFLIKNNHLSAVDGDIQLAVRRCRALDSEKKLEIEVRTLDELAVALDMKPDEILLDNMSPEQIESALLQRASHPHGSSILFEASGGISLDNLELYAATGVERVSIGALTHSARAVDISMRLSS